MIGRRDFQGERKEGWREELVVAGDTNEMQNKSDIQNGREI